MKRLPTRLEEVVLLELSAHEDERGYLLEAYRRDSYRRHGIDVEFVQDNHSRSLRGVLRGLHYQAEPGQAKLVRCARGRVWDVAVDVRPGSATFGEWEGFELSGDDHRQVYLPPGFAHGFCVLSAEADLIYKMSTYYDPEAERGIAWDDPELAIRWPVESPVLSERDRSNPPLSAAAALR